MVWLPDGENIVDMFNNKICLFVLTESTNVMNRHTDGRTDRAGVKCEVRGRKMRGTVRGRL